MIAVFCYGTLEFPEIMAAVTGRSFSATAVSLGGYARFLIKNAPYPAIIATAGAQVEGTLYRGIDPASLRLLDRYEGTLYVRQAVTIRITGVGEIKAQTYVLPQQRRWALSSKQWDKAHFARHHLKNYLARLSK